MAFSVKERNRILNNLKKTNYDVVIIGGGVTGAGALLDAQSRGLKACLVEMQDFSQGTSSRSTKLIHGGLRYLKQGDLQLVAEVGKERNTLFKNAPYLTQPTEVIIPFIVGGSMGKFTAKLAMIAYEFLAKVEKRFKHKILKKRHVINLLPNLNRENLKGGVIYYEYKTNDSRLVLENIKKAVSIGAQALNYIKATKFIYNNEKISGIEVIDKFTNETFVINTKGCVSAVGPWTDEIMKFENASAPKKVVLTKGVHIVFSKEKFSLENAIYFEVGDGRMVFAVPKFDKVYIGTTDTFYKDEIADPSISKEDVQYIIDAIHTNFDKVRLTLDDVIAAWSGLRPLIKEEGKGESEISRKDEIFTTDTGLIAIAGGKLTGYRKMAEKVIDLVEEQIVEREKTTFRACKTEHIQLLGFDSKTEKMFVTAAMMNNDISELQAEQLYHWFGKQAYQVLRYKSIIGLPDNIGKSLRYCFDNEMVTNPIDFLIHRTQLAYFDLDQALTYLPIVYDFLKKETMLLTLHTYEDQLLSLKEFKKN